MNKLWRDKIVAILGSGLLGYYLAMSLFRGIIWEVLLLKVLPPINPRHLPTEYIGIMGAVLGVMLGFIIFTRLVEKKAFTAYKRQYLAALGLLLFAPLVIAGAFRLHAVNLVSKAESTVPTELDFNINGPGNQIMFATSASSGTGIIKSVVIEGERLAEAGKAIKEMELTEVVPGGKQTPDPDFTIWINYRVNGKWFSKILTYGEGTFEESIAGNGFARYQSEALEELLIMEVEKAADLGYYTKARIMSQQTLAGDNHDASLTDQQFSRLLQAVSAAGKFEPSLEVREYFKNLGENDVSRNETNIYAISLAREGEERIGTQNFMIYDELTHTLMFEGDFYQVDLESLLEEVL